MKYTIFGSKNQTFRINPQHGSKYIQLTSANKPFQTIIETNIYTKFDDKIK